MEQKNRQPNQLSLADYSEPTLDKALHKDLLKRGLLESPKTRHDKARAADVLTNKAAKSDHWKDFCFMLNPRQEPAATSFAASESDLKQTKKYYLKQIHHSKEHDV